MTSFYEILGVSRHATPDEVRAAFRSAASRNHPDRFATYLQKLQATRRMQDITAAYATLKDAEARARYDRDLDSRGTAKSRSTTRPHRPSESTAGQIEEGSFFRDPVRIGLALLWLTVTAGFAFVLYQGEPEPSALALAKSIGFAVAISPVLMMFAGAVVLFPAAMVIVIAGQFFSEKSTSLPQSRGRLLLDLVVRIVALAALSALAYGAWSRDMLFEYLFYALLAGIGAVGGEILALLVFGFRIRKVRSALRTLDPEGGNAVGARGA